MEDAARLAHIRDQLDAIAPGDFSRAYDGNGCFLEGRAEMGEMVPIARFADASDAEIAFIVDAPANVRFLLGLVDRAIHAMRPADRQAEPTALSELFKNYAAQAAMRCKEPGFKRFLEERHGLERPLTDERSAQKLRSLLGVRSRAELNVDAVALQRWKKINGDFENWKRAG